MTRLGALGPRVRSTALARWPHGAALELPAGLSAAVALALLGAADRTGDPAAALRVVTFASVGGSLLGLLAGALVYGAVVLRAAGPAGGTGPGALGSLVPARLLLVVCVALGTPGHHMAWRSATWTAAALLLVATLLEPAAQAVQPVPDVAGLPGMPAPPGGPVARWVTPAAVAVLALGALLDLLGAGGRWWLLAALAPAVLTGAAGLIGGYARYRRGARTALLRQRLQAYQPVLAIHLARSTTSTYQVRMWLPYLRELGVPLLIVTRDHGGVVSLAARTGLPVVCRPTWRDLDDVLTPTLRLAVYVNSVASNADLVTYRQLRHVYLGHGESDKALSTHPAHAMYDYILVAGPAAIVRYAEAGLAIPAEKFVQVGRPQIADLRTGPADRLGIAPDRVLYAPTWAGYNASTSYSSLPRAQAVLRALLDRGATVTFRPHPFSRQRPSEAGLVRAVDALLAADAAATGRPHAYGPHVEQSSFVQCADAAAVLVCDLSSVLTDYLHAARPFAIVSTPASALALAQDRLLARAGLVVRPDLENLAAVVAQLIGPDLLAQQRALARAYYLGADEQDPVRRFTQALHAILVEPGRPGSTNRGPAAGD